MAIQLASTRGKNVTKNRRTLLLKKLLLAMRALNRSASVCPARMRKIMPRPANAEAECPEGNDNRPFLILLCLLSLVCQGGQLWHPPDPSPVHSLRAASQTHRSRKSGRSRPSLLLGKYDEGKSRRTDSSFD